MHTTENLEKYREVEGEYLSIFILWHTRRNYTNSSVFFFTMN